MDNKSTPTEKFGKKLVQARLPFKVLSSTEKNELVLNSTEKIKPVDSNAESETKSKDSIEENPEKKINLVTEEVVLLSDDDEDSKKKSIKDEDLSKKHSINLDKQIKTPDQKSTKVFIKLPISSKKKKRKSMTSDESVDNGETDKNTVNNQKSEPKCNANKKVKISDSVVKEKFDDGSSIINSNCPTPDESKNQETLCIANKTCDKSKNSNEVVQEIMEIDDLEKEEAAGSLKSSQPDIKSTENDKLEEDTNKNLENTQILLEENKNENTESKTNQSSENSLISSETVQKSENESSDSNKTASKELNTLENDKNLSLDKKDEKNQTDENELDCSIINSTFDLTATSDLETSISTETPDLNKSKSNKRTRNKVNDKSVNEKSKRVSTSRTRNDTKEQERLEKEDQKRKEKEAKEQKRLQEKLERETKEQKRIQEKLEKEEMRRKEKDEKEKKRLLEIEAKNEEKRLREEERRKKEELKEEEKRKKEEERKKKEDEKKKKELEMENKKKKAAEVFTKFFVPSRNPKGTEENISVTEKVDNNFMPFQIKDDMKLAPIARRFLNPEEKSAIDQILNNELVPPSDLYIKQLKSDYQPLKCGRTLPSIEDDDEIIIIDEVHGTSQCIDTNSKCSKKYRAKYFMFRENRRPPYYGTWRKKSTVIKPRKPFQTDKTIFDYEIDSDLEWEEEEPGESLSSSDNEKESEDEYEVDNEFFVPHGHLSDEELEEEEDQSPEVQKAKLKILQQEFACEMKKKTEKLKPRLIGVVWSNKDLSKPESCPTIVWEFLKQRQMISNGQIKIVSQKEINTENNSPNQPEKPIKLLKRTELPEEYIKSLIKLVHGNRNNKLFIIKEFQAYLTKNNANPESVQFTKSCLREKIESMSQWKVMKNNTLKKKFLCYVVSKEFLDKYDLGDLDIQNKWEYIIPPKVITVKENVEEEETTTTTPSKPVKSVENSPVITKFAKVLTKEKKQKLLEENKEDVKLISNEKKTPKVIQNKTNIITKTTTPETSSPTTLTKVTSTAKKRVPILFSVPRGQKVPEASKKIAVDDFLNQQSKTSQKPSPKTRSAFDKDETIVIE